MKLWDKTTWIDSEADAVTLKVMFWLGGLGGRPGPTHQESWYLSGIGRHFATLRLAPVSAPGVGAMVWSLTFGFWRSWSRSRHCFRAVFSSFIPEVMLFPDTELLPLSGSLPVPLRWLIL